MALHFGCDDFGSTMIEENVVSAAGAPTKVSPVMMPKEIHRQIRQAGFIPAQRNTDYEVLKVFDTPEAEVDLNSIAEVEQQAAQHGGTWQNVTLIE
jgi:cyclic dehypoxanthinyl futalosine synthase